MNILCLYKKSKNIHLYGFGLHLAPVKFLALGAAIRHKSVQQPAKKSL